MFSLPGSCFTSLAITGCGKTKDRVIINVGGTRHECYISTIQNFPDTRLFWIAETALNTADFDPEGNEFFFDRHPQCFANILNYCRTGKLHCPNDVCGPLFEQELAFWGVDELMMEPCCWGTYTQHRDAHKNLSMFDEIHNNAKGAPEDEFEYETDENEILMGSASTKSRLRGSNKSKMTLRERMAALRPQLWSILEKPFSSVYAQVSAFISLIIILMSLTTFCAETVKYFEEEKAIFNRLEYFYCAFFTFELALRLWCCPSKKKYFTSAMTWIDIISTAQFFISFLLNTQAFDFLFVTRLLRVFRLFRFFKNLSGMQVIAQTLKASANELLLLCIIVLIPMVIFSTCVFYAENGQPNNKFSSIPGTFWWAIVTMTTVGYGDITPTSLGGRIIGALAACSGVLIVALPVSVIGSNFSLYYSYAQARMRLPKRKSPALVSADKALIPNTSSVTTNVGGFDNKAKDGRNESIGPGTLQSVDTHVINASGFNNFNGGLITQSPNLSPQQQHRQQPAIPTTTQPPSRFARDRSSRRRHAIQPSTNPINSPITGNTKSGKLGTTRRCRKVSKTVTDKIREENCYELVNGVNERLNTKDESDNKEIRNCSSVNLCNNDLVNDETDKVSRNSYGNHTSDDKNGKIVGDEDAPIKETNGDVEQQQRYGTEVDEEDCRARENYERRSDDSNEYENTDIFPRCHQRNSLPILNNSNNNNNNNNITADTKRLFDGSNSDLQQQHCLQQNQQYEENPETRNKQDNDKRNIYKHQHSAPVTYTNAFPNSNTRQPTSWAGKRGRSISAHTPPALPSPRRNVIHGDELLYYQPKRLTAVEQKLRRKLTFVPKYHTSPSDETSEENLPLLSLSMTGRGVSDQGRDFTQSFKPPWMIRAAMDRSISPINESIVI